MQTNKYRVEYLNKIGGYKYGYNVTGTRTDIKIERRLIKNRGGVQIKIKRIK